MIYLFEKRDIQELVQVVHMATRRVWTLVRIDGHKKDKFTLDTDRMVHSIPVTSPLGRRKMATFLNTNGYVPLGATNASDPATFLAEFARQNVEAYKHTPTNQWVHKEDPLVGPNCRCTTAPIIEVAVEPPEPTAKHNRWGDEPDWNLGPIDATHWQGSTVDLPPVFMKMQGGIMHRWWNNKWNRMTDHQVAWADIVHRPFNRTPGMDSVYESVMPAPAPLTPEQLAELAGHAAPAPIPESPERFVGIIPPAPVPQPWQAVRGPASVEPPIPAPMPESADPVPVDIVTEAVPDNYAHPVWMWDDFEWEKSPEGAEAVFYSEPDAKVVWLQLENKKFRHPFWRSYLDGKWVICGRSIDEAEIFYPDESLNTKHKANPTHARLSPGYHLRKWLELGDDYCKQSADDEHQAIYPETDGEPERTIPDRVLDRGTGEDIDHIL